MSIAEIFHDSWWKMAIGYGILFYAFQYITYKIIFKIVVGQPDPNSWKAIRFWRRKAIFIGAVIFAPLFEEFMITWLAYSSFLQYAKAGQEGVIVILVAVFFALLHIPVDWHRQRNSYWGIRPFTLLVWQFDRFFYSLCAYFLFKITGNLWSSIVLHYLVNAMVSFYNFDLEDRTKAVGSVDILLFLIVLSQIGIVLFGTYQFQLEFPVLGLKLVVMAVVYLAVYLFRLRRVFSF